MAKILTGMALGATLIVAAGCAEKKAPITQLPPSDRVPPAAVGRGGGGGGDDGAGTHNEQFKREVRSNTIHFSFDQYDIDSTARAILDSQVAWLVRHPGINVTIEGHCDERGTREYNLALGDRRANSTKNYLAANGVSPSRITTISYGKERPIALGSDEASWAMNRRAVTIVVN